MRARARGMTLIEVLVAMALLAMLGAGITAAYTFGRRTYARVLSVDRSYWDVTVPQRLLRVLLESVQPLDQRQQAVALTASANELEFSATDTFAGGRLGLRRFKIATRRAADGSTDLMLRSTLDRGGAPTSDVGKEDADVLVARIASVQWDFLAPGEDRMWHTTWQHPRPPALIRVRVRFPQGDPRVWPPLIVAPRLTDDPNCEFDMIAQTCRSSAP